MINHRLKTADRAVIRGTISLFAIIIAADRLLLFLHVLFPP